MEEKHWNHNITATDTAKDLAMVICDIYANTETRREAIHTILDLCNKIIKGE